MPHMRNAIVSRWGVTWELSGSNFESVPFYLWAPLSGNVVFCPQLQGCRRPPGSLKLELIAQVNERIGLFSST